MAVPTALLGAAAAPAAPVRITTAVAADQQPTCGDPAAVDFPIDTRIHGGPDTYASGGGYGVWYLDLVNTTTESCRALHPVLVLTDEDRALTAEQIQVAFSERDAPSAEHRVVWETTDQDEQVGVFGGATPEDGFAGFTVPAGRTVTVRVRMAFTSDTRPGKVVANAAVVQRHQGRSERPKLGAASAGPGHADGKTAPPAADRGDGEWVGESGAYPFTIVEGSLGGGRDESLPPWDAEGTTSGTGTDGTDGTDGTAEPGAGETGGDAGIRTDGDARTGGDRETDGDVGTRTGGAGDGGRLPGTGEASHPPSGAAESPRPLPRTSSGAGTGVGPRSDATPGEPDEVPGRNPAQEAERDGNEDADGNEDGEADGGRDETLRDAEGDALPELAHTGPGTTLRAGLAAGVFLLIGVGAVLAGRRMRRVRI
ncbi:peptidase [uncultured Streptomyces sp.]|uniref:peptidase n=1 Tax=uncultured Streptomyces sp. TaxID=174707 RepID=UPI00262BF64C|nr:peptidase [uncultured Streptomyces sp.]